MNLDRADQRDFDVAYALSLSPDATPTVVSGLSRLEPDKRCELAEALAGREVDSGGWQAWNYGRTKTNDSLDDSRTGIESNCLPE